MLGEQGIHHHRRRCRITVVLTIRPHLSRKARAEGLVKTSGAVVPIVLDDCDITIFTGGVLAAVAHDIGIIASGEDLEMAPRVALLIKP